MVGVVVVVVVVVCVVVVTGVVVITVVVGTVVVTYRHVEEGDPVHPVHPRICVVLYAWHCASVVHCVQLPTRASEQLNVVPHA